MPADDLLATLDALALSVLLKAGALRRCEVHPDITIRAADEGAEYHAIALGKIDLWGRGKLHLQEALKLSIVAALAAAADGKCPWCG